MGGALGKAVEGVSLFVCLWCGSSLEVVDGGGVGWGGGEAVYVLEVGLGVKELWA